MPQLLRVEVSVALPYDTDDDLRIGTTPKDAQDAIDGAADALTLLDALDADPARRAAAISDIKTRWP